MTTSSIAPRGQNGPRIHAGPGQCAVSMREKKPDVVRSGRSEQRTAHLAHGPKKETIYARFTNIRQLF